MKLLFQSITSTTLLRLSHADGQVKSPCKTGSRIRSPYSSSDLRHCFKHTHDSVKQRPATRNYELQRCFTITCVGSPKPFDSVNHSQPVFQRVMVLRGFGSWGAEDCPPQEFHSSNRVTPTETKKGIGTGRAYISPMPHQPESGIVVFGPNCNKNSPRLLLCISHPSDRIKQASGPSTSPHYSKCCPKIRAIEGWRMITGVRRRDPRGAT